MRDGTEFEKMLPYHKCTDEDFSLFYPVAKKSEGEIKVIRADPKKNLFCLDKWTDDLFVGGDETGENYQTLEVLMVPCNYIHKTGPAAKI